MTPRDALANFFPAYYGRTYLFDADFEDADAIIAHLNAAGYIILPAAEVEKIERALRRAEDGAGTLPAKNSVKLVPADWHALAACVRALKGAKP